MELPAVVTASRFHARLAVVAAVVILAPATAHGGSRGALPREPLPLLGGPSGTTNEDAGPLAPFRIRLGSGIEEVTGRLASHQRRSLRSGDTTYVRVEAPSGPETPGIPGPALPAPEGMTVVDSDFWFDAKGALIEASLVLEMETETAIVVHELVGWLGRPDFEIVLPGGLDMLVGWRSPKGYLLGSFSDIPVFQLSAFRHEPDDLLTGTHLVLFEGLSDYSQGLANGEPPAELLRELMSVVSWVEKARRSLETAP